MAFSKKINSFLISFHLLPVLSKINLINPDMLIQLGSTLDDRIVDKSPGSW
jgi:hypothetical protein